MLRVNPSHNLTKFISFNEGVLMKNLLILTCLLLVSSVANLFGSEHEDWKWLQENYRQELNRICGTIDSDCVWLLSEWYHADHCGDDCDTGFIVEPMVCGNDCSKSEERQINVERFQFYTRLLQQLKREDSKVE